MITITPEERDHALAFVKESFKFFLQDMQEKNPHLSREECLEEFFCTQLASLWLSVSKIDQKNTFTYVPNSDGKTPLQTLS